MNTYLRKHNFIGGGLGFAVIALAGMAAAESKSPAESNSAAKPTFDQAAAFEKLKQLDGKWTGSTVYGMLNDPQPIPKVAHKFHITSGGYTVTETLFAGTDMEMLSVFYMDGDDLVLTHYCSFGGGTQSNMKLDVENSTKDELRFVFVDGHNIPDPMKDRHIHKIRLNLANKAQIESEIIAHVNGVPAEFARSTLSPSTLSPSTPSPSTPSRSKKRK